MREFWKGRNVFVTGSQGFVGSRLTKRLVDEAANVVVLIRDDHPRLWHLGETQARLHGIIKGDITDYDVVARLLNEYEIEVVFHLAAQAIVGVANRSPLSTFESNIKGTWNILEAARNSSGLKRLVVASSDKAYGDHDRLPYSEEYPLNAIHPYDASKACADILARTYACTYALPISITRCANIYGGGDLNFSRIIPDTIRALIRDSEPVIRSDGSPIRDYMYLDDAVNAYLTLAEQMDRPEVKGQVFNFGAESPISVIDLVEMMIRISGKTHLKAVIAGKGKPLGEIQAQYLSSQKAKALLGWQPEYNLEEGLRESFAWYQAYLTH